MNAFERRLAQFAACPVAGPLVHRLTAFQRLERELDMLRWRLRGGMIDGETFLSWCQQLDKKLDPISPFIDRFVSNTGRYIHLQQVIERQLPARLVTVCRAALVPLDQWYQTYELSRCITLDMSFHVRIEVLLQDAEEVVAAHVRALSRPTPPPEAPQLSWVAEDKELARVQVHRGITDAEARVEGKSLKQADWTQLRRFRKAIDHLLQLDQVHEAFWLMLQLEAWAAAATNFPRKTLKTFQHSDQEHNRIMEGASKVTTRLPRIRAVDSQDSERPVD